uniref:Uncharacterized protein n=1 Tax=Salix viminalis TaxID=40686 RepID=A0A6N2LUR8_SALVM
METLQEICSCRASKKVLKSNDLNGCSRPERALGGYLTTILIARRVQSFLFISEEEVALLIESTCFFFFSNPCELNEKILSLQTLLAGQLLERVFKKSKG